MENSELIQEAQKEIPFQKRRLVYADHYSDVSAFAAVNDFFASRKQLLNTRWIHSINSGFPINQGEDQTGDRWHVKLASEAGVCQPHSPCGKGCCSRCRTGNDTASSRSACSLLWTERTGSDSLDTLQWEESKWASQSDPAIHLFTSAVGTTPLKQSN